MSARKRTKKSKGAGTDLRLKVKSNRGKVEAAERLETYIRCGAPETGRWWYGRRANRLACRACGLSRKELADAVEDLVLEGRAYFGRNRYFPFLKLVSFLEEREKYGTGRSLAA